MCYLVTKKSQSRFLGFGPSLDLASSDEASVRLQHVSLNSQEDIERLSNPAFSSLRLLAPSATTTQTAWFQIFSPLVQPAPHTWAVLLKNL